VSRAIAVTLRFVNPPTQDVVSTVAFVVQEPQRRFSLMATVTPAAVQSAVLRRLLQQTSSSVRVLILPPSMPGDASAEDIATRLAALVSNGALNAWLPDLDAAANLQPTPMEPCTSDASGYCPVEADAPPESSKSFFERVGLAVVIVVLVGAVIVLAALVGGVCYCRRKRAQEDLARLRAAQADHAAGAGGAGVYSDRMSSAFDNRTFAMTSNPAAMELYAVQPMAGGTSGSELDQINHFAPSEAF